MINYKEYTSSELLKELTKCEKYLKIDGIEGNDIIVSAISAIKAELDERSSFFRWNGKSVTVEYDHNLVVDISEPIFYIRDPKDFAALLTYFLQK